LYWGALGTPLGRHGALCDTSGPSWAVVGCLRKLGAVLGRTRLHDGFLFCLGVLRHGCAIQDGSRQALADRICICDLECDSFRLGGRFAAVSKSVQSVLGPLCSKKTWWT